MTRANSSRHDAFGLTLLSCTTVLTPLVAVPATLLASEATKPLFATSDRCLACHNNLITAHGEDVSIGLAWRASMMANAARDPYWQAAVRREALDHVEHTEAIEAECSICHMPMSRYEARRVGRAGEVFAHLAALGSGQPDSALAMDGVSCTVCHQIQNRGLGDRDTFNGGFSVDEEMGTSPRRVNGRFDIEAGRARIMSSASGHRPEQGDHISRSELCAPCHTLFTRVLDAEALNLDPLPEQVPYLEWLHSDYPDSESCQSCHLPSASGALRFSSTWGAPRNQLAEHVFRGANAFMAAILGRFGFDLGVEASPLELETAAHKTRQHLEEEAAALTLRAEQTPVELMVEVTVQPLAGHKVPTAYPSRRVWLHVTVHDQHGVLVFESGRPEDSGAIMGNDNDVDATRYEPHYQTIRAGDQVQIYETIMGTPRSEVTTGLLSASQYLKDNRLLPAGFDKNTADKTIAVCGSARDDPDFVGGSDKVVYLLPTAPGGRPLTVAAELLYQPISHRWAQNLRTSGAVETDRFVRYYEATTARSTVRLAHAALLVR